jgi:cell division protein FtsQ
MWNNSKLLNAMSGCLLGFVALMLLGAALVWLAQRPMFALQSIQIEAGANTPLRHINLATIRSIALPQIRGNFFSVNLESVRQAFEAVPWIHKAAVRREWPNQVIVSVEEHQPLATWGDEGRLVSVKGDVFTANLDEAEEDGELPALSGPAGSEKEVVSRFNEINHWLASIQVEADTVTLSDRYAWNIRLDNGINIDLGTEQDKQTLRNRITRLIAIYPQLALKVVALNNSAMATKNEKNK